MAALVIATVQIHAAPPAARHDRTALAARQVLQRPAAAGRWEREPLRNALKLLAELHDINVFMDRRVNPDAPLSGHFPATSLGELLEAIGRRHGFGVTEIEGVVYVGPPMLTQRLRTLDRLRRSEVRELNTRWSRSLLTLDTLQWPDLASPRDLVEQVCQRAGVSLANGERIPHDLWVANRLPRLSRATQLTILLAGFDLTFDCRGDGTLMLRPVRDDERWEQNYPLPAGGTEIVQELRQELPTAILTVERNRVHVAGLVEEHEVALQWLRHRGRPPATEPRQSDPAGELRFDLRVVRRPLGAVLDEIERSTQYRFLPDREARQSGGLPLDQIISFEVHKADIDVLMQALQEESGLGFRRDGNKIQILVRP